MKARVHSARLDAERIARKLRALEQARWEARQALRPLMAFHVVLLVDGIYNHAATLHAASHEGACRQFLKAWPSRTRNCAVVMRAPCGKRYDHDASAVLVGHRGAWGFRP